MSLRKFQYYTYNGMLSILPHTLFKWYARRLLSKMSQFDSESVHSRLNYYNKLSDTFNPALLDFSVKNFHKTGGTTYYFDLVKVIKCFNKDFRFNCEPGDVTNIPEQPSFVKSRPISNHNANSVILKLNAVRHFNFVEDSTSFINKENRIVWRGLGKKPHRKVVLEKFHDHPRCDIGRTSPIEGKAYEKNFLSIQEQLKYKFILAIEGNDVATNLKWAMSSNSLVVMTKPKFETWFMEGRLIPGVHYVEVQPDYSDMIEKIDYYIKHPYEAEEIIHNAHQWVEQFLDRKKESLISLLVAQKYFSLSTK